MELLMEHEDHCCDGCAGCTCCSDELCHRGPDSDCPTDSIGDFVCPCTED
jgi:hypothetical protein